MVSDYTRVTHCSKTIIDLIFSSNPEIHKCTKVFPISLSDHYLIYTIIDLGSSSKTKEQTHREIRYRSYKNFNAEKFLDDIRHSSFITDVLNSENVNDAWFMFKEEFLKICNKHAPICVSRMKNRYCPWIDNNILQVMYKRDHLHKLAAQSSDPDVINEYNSVRNEVNSLVNDAKKRYYDELYNEGEK